MAQPNPELAIQLLEEDLALADIYFPEDEQYFDTKLALDWLLRVYVVFRPIIKQARRYDYTTVLSRLNRSSVRQETPEQTRLDLYSAAGQVAWAYNSLDQRKRQ